jgi:hypothetical protein
MLISSLWPFSPHPHDLVGTVGEWRFVAHQDRFSGRTICTLRARSAFYERGVVMFSLPPRENVTDALFRVDDGPALAVRDNDLEIARAGLPIYQDDKGPLDHGLGRIPQHYLHGARKVSFQTRQGGRTYQFKVTGLDSALAAALASGCATDAFEEVIRAGN